MVLRVGPDRLLNRKEKQEKGKNTRGHIEWEGLSQRADRDMLPRKRCSARLGALLTMSSL